MYFFFEIRKYAKKTMIVSCGDSFTVILTKRRTEADEMQMLLENEKKKPGEKPISEMDAEILAMLQGKSKREIENEENEELKKLRLSPRKTSPLKLPKIQIKVYQKQLRQIRAESELKPRGRKLLDVCSNFGPKLQIQYPENFLLQNNKLRALKWAKLSKNQESKINKTIDYENKPKSTTILNKSLIKYYIERSFDQRPKNQINLETQNMSKKFTPSSKLFTSPSVCEHEHLQKFQELTKDQKIIALQHAIECCNSEYMTINTPKKRTLSIAPQRNIPRNLVASPSKMTLSAEREEIDKSESIQQKKIRRNSQFVKIMGKKIRLFL